VLTGFLTAGLQIQQLRADRKGLRRGVLRTGRGPDLTGMQRVLLDHLLVV
jgi:hypothetical protein